MASEISVDETPVITWEGWLDAAQFEGDLLRCTVKMTSAVIQRGEREPGKRPWISVSGEFTAK